MDDRMKRLVESCEAFMAKSRALGKEYAGAFIEHNDDYGQLTLILEISKLFEIQDYIMKQIESHNFIYDFGGVPDNDELLLGLNLALKARRDELMDVQMKILKVSGYV